MKFRFSRKNLAIPYFLFLVLFVLLPICIIVFYAFTDEMGNFTLAAFENFFTSTEKLNVLLISLLIGLLNTALCLLIGYPIAYILAKKELKFGYAVVLLFVMPMWINFVLRTSATRDLLYSFGLSGGDHPYIATMIGMVYNYLPFVILPLYSTMQKMDYSLVEASMDLGANKFQTFYKTIIPMTLPGIISAASMVFMPTMSSFVISDVMGERQISLIGNTIQLYFDQGLWNLGSFVALILLVIILGFMIATRNMEKEDNVRGGLW